MPDKIKKRTELEELSRRLKQNGKKIVFTNGCFDILHAGHIKLLKNAKDLGDILVVAINTDESVRRLKGKNRPINELSDRAKVLAGLEVVDYVVPFSELDPAKIIRQIKPDILVKGGDWKAKAIVGKEFVESYGGRVVTIPYLKGYSTSRLLEKLLKKKTKKNE